MINVSREFKEHVKSAREFIASAEIELSSGTILNITDSQIRSMKIDDSVTKSGAFILGGTIINKLSIIIDNLDETFTDYDFTDAIIRPSVGLQLSSTIETIQKGVYVVDEVKTSGQVISIIALDLINNFDTPFKDVTQIFPCTLSDLLYSVCLHCGVPVASFVFCNNNYTVQNRPLDDAVTCREILSWIAQIAGCFARMDNTGYLTLRWYDYDVFTVEERFQGGRFDHGDSYTSGDDASGGTFDDYESGDDVDGGDFDYLDSFHHLYALGSITVANEDIVVTGLQVSDVTETPNTVLYGQTGYVISIEKNQLIQSQSDANMTCSAIGPLITGMRFRPMSISAVSDPSREAGDAAFISDNKGRIYQTLITGATFSITQNDKIVCEAESPLKKKSVRYPETTKVLIEAKKNTQEKIAAYDLTVQQFLNLMTHGFGLYKTEEVLPDGSTVYYMHDKPSLAESNAVWKFNSNGIFLSTDHGLTWGVDTNGNMLVNVLTAVGINADWIRAGRILSTSGSTLIDLEKGVANSDNISFTDNVADGFPLRMPFNIDDNTSVITKVLLKFTIDKFRTYSTTTSSSGSSTQTSSAGGGVTKSSSFNPIITHVEDFDLYDSGYSSRSTSNAGAFNGASGTSDGSVGDHAHNININTHSHGYSIPGHGHSFSVEFYTDSHNHSITLDNHTHDLSIPGHSHGLEFGIMEAAVSHNLIAVVVDGVTVTSANAQQGIIDLTQYITTTGWHTIELQSATKKKISAQISIKSYIQM